MSWFRYIKNSLCMYFVFFQSNVPVVMNTFFLTLLNPCICLMMPEQINQDNQGKMCLDNLNIALLK